jgi:DNA-binding transcriptional LysR family regulator
LGSTGSQQMNISSRQLTAFVLIARHGSFSRAAEHMYITQSGISIIVRDLEAQLGFRLFDRTTRKVKVSELGARFLPVATRCLSELEGAAQSIRRGTSAAIGRILVAGFTALDAIGGCLATAVTIAA